jgi:hypothetical protein
MYWCGPLQVFKELSVDPTACQLQLQYNLPQGASRVAAALSAKLLLTLPGTNGEPAWQEFELNSILSGQQGQQPRCDFTGKFNMRIISWMRCPMFPALHLSEPISSTVIDGDLMWVLCVVDWCMLQY